jgi:hypothetical protein
MAEDRWEVRIGSPVTTTDGKYGHLQQLLVDPQEAQVVGLLVRPPGLLPYHPVVVPESAIAGASEDEVRLNIRREEVQVLPEYQPEAVLVLDGQIYEVADELSGPEREHQGLLIQAGQQVFCQDELVGWVSLILLEPGGRVRGFVLHTGHLFGRNLIVPATGIQEVRRNHVYLSMEKADLESLPDYGLDDALAAEVEKALWSDEILCNTDYSEIDPAGFTSPPARWQPPYPYRWEQVLCDRERLEEL